MSHLEAGICIAKAPCFHSDHALGERLQMNSGVVIERGRILPRDDWRPLMAEELALLVATYVSCCVGIESRNSISKSRGRSN